MSSTSSAVDRFERTLSETVTSEKLSGSRVEKVRNLAARDFHLATQLTRAIQTVHRRASDKGKISSLYLLDAVARNAQDVVRKKASGFDYKEARPPNGSAARAGTKEAMVDAANAFLSACEEIIEDMVLTTARSMRSDQKDKVTKVVDIWLKAGTFNSGLLDKIRGKILNGDDSDAMENEARSGQEIGSTRGHHTTTSPPPAPPNVPSNILAMLGGGSGVGSGDSGSVAAKEESTNPPSLDPNQLAMLQRVAAQQQQQQQQQHPQQQQQQQGSSESRLPQTSTSETNKAQADTLSFHPDVSVGDLSQFDLSSFDPTVALHWLRLAQQWHNTYQYIPSNQELMTGLASVMQTQMYMQTQMMQAGSSTGYNGSGQW